MNIQEFEGKVYSQFGEDNITLEIVRRLPDIPRWFIEIGCGDGSENNTRVLLEAGWQGLWIDGSEANIAKAKAVNPLSLAEFVTAETQIVPAGAGTGVFSLDIDENDYWVWRALSPQLKPWVCIIECQVQRSGEYIMEYDPAYVWDHASHDCGASYDSMVALGRELGYTSLGLLSDPKHQPNAFFVRDDLMERLG